MPCTYEHRSQSRADINTQPETFLTEREVAQRQARSVRTLQNQRVTGGGIPFCKFGRSVRYRLSDVVDWERASSRASTSSLGGVK